MTLIVAGKGWSSMRVFCWVENEIEIEIEIESEVEIEGEVEGEVEGAGVRACLCGFSK